MEDIKRWVATFLFLLFAAIVLSMQGTYNAAHGQEIVHKAQVPMMMWCIDNVPAYKKAFLSANPNNQYTIIGISDKFKVVLYFFAPDKFSIWNESIDGETACQMTAGEIFDDSEKSEEPTF